MSVFAGQKVGTYQILEQLGRGRLSLVHREYDTRLERDAAIKFFRSEAIKPAKLPTFCIHFDQEVNTLVDLKHPNIAEVYDNGRYEELPYLVMEYLSGGSLKNIIGHSIPHNKAAHILTPIAHALEYAHLQGIIHRDIKPSNILFSKNGACVRRTGYILKL